MEQEKEYFAFISYQRQDEEWAKWLADQLEHYHLPLTLNGRDDLPKDLRPIFRDIDELAAGNLPKQIYQALNNSKNLIVVCSPNSVKSPWVNKEVETFIGIGKLDNIFPFIIDGVPFSKNKDEECLPEALRKLSDDKERLGANVKEYKDSPQRLCKDCPLPKGDRDNKKQGDINEKGRDAAVVKIVAGMLGAHFDTLWQRYEREKAEEERRIKEQRDNLLRAKSRFLAEKANSLVDEGDSYTARLLIMEAIRTPSHPDYPYTVEAERALRRIDHHHCAILRGHANTVHSARFSHNGKLIVSASWDETVRVWDAQTGKCIRIMEGHTSSVEFATFSPDDQLIASASSDKTIRLWGVASGNCIRVLSGHAANVNSVDFSHDGNFLVAAVGSCNNYSHTANEERAAYVWDLATGQCLFILKGHLDKVNHAVFSSDDSVIASASDDKTVCLWNSTTGERMMTLESDDKSVESLCFIPRNHQLLSCGYGDIYVWNYQTGQLIQKIPTGGQAHSLTYSEQSKQIGTIVGNNVHIWDATTYEEVKVIQVHLPFRETAYAIHFSPDGKNMVYAASDQNVRILDVTSENYVLLSGHKDFVTNTCFSPDGKLLASCSEQHDRTIRVWDVLTAGTKRILTGHTNRIKSVAFSPDGRMIVSASHDKSVRFWTVEGAELLKIESLEGGFNSVSVSPDGQYVACAQDGETSLWNIRERKCIWVAEGSYRDSSNSVAYSPDGEYVAAAWGYSIQIRRAQTGDLVMVLDHHDDFIFSVSYSHDGSRIASASRDKNIKIWNAYTGECLLVLRHTSDVTAAKFSPDDTVIVSSSWDGTVRIWNASDGNCLYVEKMEASLSSISFSPLGSKVAFSAPGRVYLQDYKSLDTMIANTINRFKERQLTPEERKKYYLD